MSAYLAESGTFLLITVGASINANVVLAQTKGHNSGWTIITIGWGIAVFLGVYTATSLGSSGHLNPAVSVGLAAFGGLTRPFWGVSLRRSQVLLPEPSWLVF